MTYVIQSPHQPSLPIRDTDSRFPVRRIYCVGRNYAAHAIEMGHDPDREPPFFFQKNPDSLVLDGRFPYPEMTNSVHHEIELVVALQFGGARISVENALDHIYGYAVGLDMTRRELQEGAKALGRPWEVGKAFEAAAPCSELVPASLIGHPADGAIQLAVNGEIRQEGDLSYMIWKVPEIVNHLSTFFMLAPGDLIFTGTPSGVGPVVAGDRLDGSVEGVGELTVTVT